MTLTRRAFLRAGAMSAALLAAWSQQPAAAALSRKPRRRIGIYSDTYADTY